jgi:hypothetical protein
VQLALTNAHRICAYLAAGHSEADAAVAMVRDNPTLTFGNARSAVRVGGVGVLPGSGLLTLLESATRSLSRIATDSSLQALLRCPARPRRTYSPDIPCTFWAALGLPA